ncbi:hypothetical protein [Duganella qianjiadongensis]|uniref:Uncharacterized protein n=1 Tax=Duganella qianjiadongensis TaxID=2692176 RepID=A0ABW9VQJ8_9BURK|nr:hypothetical protein [Duganella qianjiadongensis]MYM41854.1 hypothetical protein [Duganella qianjiadongensis]
MKEQINIIENRPQEASLRPYLKSSVQEAGNYNWRILQQLEHGAQTGPARMAQAHWNIEQWIIGLGILIAIICTSAWYLQPRRSEPAMAVAMSGPAGKPEVADLLARPAQAAPSPESAAAHIVSTAVIDEPPARHTASYAAPRHERTPAHKTSLPANQPATLPDKAPRNPPADASMDRDAALLAALVAHGNTNLSATGTGNRDIVERQANDNTGHLLQRCQQLGMIEGMLCRSRICAGRWESDQACRQPFNPASSP